MKTSFFENVNVNKSKFEQVDPELLCTENNNRYNRYKNKI